MPTHDVQHFQQKEALGRGSGLVNGVIAVRGADGLADVGVVPGEVGLGEETPNVVEPFDQSGGQIAAVEGVCAALGNPANGFRKVRIDQHLPDAGRTAAVGEINVRCGGEAREEFRVASEGPSDAWRYREPSLSVLDGRSQQVSKGHGAEAAVHGFPGCGLARHGNRVGSLYGHLRQTLAAIVLGFGARRGDPAAIDVGDPATFGVVGENERVAAQTAHRYERDAFHRGDSEGRVECSPSSLQDA